MVFVAAAEQSADPEQRVVAVAAVTERVVLHPPANLVDARRSPSRDDVEGIQHPGGVRQTGAQRGGVATERVQRRHPDTITPSLVAAGNPCMQSGSAAPVDHVEQPRTAVQVDDPGDEPGARPRVAARNAVSSTPTLSTPSSRLVIVDQRLPVVADRGHHGAPADPELGGHRATVCPSSPTRRHASREPAR